MRHRPYALTALYARDPRSNAANARLGRVAPLAAVLLWAAALPSWGATARVVVVPFGESEGLPSSMADDLALSVKAALRGEPNVELETTSMPKSSQAPSAGG